MNRVITDLKSEKFKEDLTDLLRDIGDWIYNFVALVLGAAVFGCALVMAFFIAHRGYADPLSISYEDALRITVIIVTAVYGIRIMKASEHLYRLFNRW